MIRRLGGRQLDALVSLNLLTPNLEQGIDAHVLIDSGCTGSCIDSGFVKRYNIPTKRYPNPLRVSNADGSTNEGGLITDYAEVEMIFETHKETLILSVMLQFSFFSLVIMLTLCLLTTYVFLCHHFYCLTQS